MRRQVSSRNRATCLIAAWMVVSAHAALAQSSANSLVPGIQPYAPRAAANGGTTSGSPPAPRPTATQAVDVPYSRSNGADVGGVRALVHAAPDHDYVLGPGDKLRITVFGEDNLSGEFSIAGNGRLSFPLIGDIDAAGQTVDTVGRAITSKLSDGYIKDPRVSAEVLTFRPYYLLGEINKPGEYPYENGISVLNAVATAGGFTYRANKKFVFLKRVSDPKEQKVRLTPELSLAPGDTVRIGERLF